MTVSLIKSCAASISNQIPSSAIGIFGGTFDPFHEGHVTIVKSALTFLSHIVIAATDQNPWKKLQPTPLKLRNEMIRLILKSEQIALTTSILDAGVSISEVSYCYSKEMVSSVKQDTSRPLFWLVGEDSASEVKDWKDWDTQGIPAISFPIELQTHATGIRQGTIALHPAIVDFAEKQQLYRLK